MKTYRTTGTGSEQTLSEIETDKIPLYPTEQDLLDDLANLEVGQIAGTTDPAESELIGVLMQKIQALEDKLESDDVYSTDEVKTNKTWIDGKPIYKVVKPLFTNTETVAHNLEVTSYTIPNIDVTNWKQIISSHGTCVSGNSGTNSDELDGKARLSGSNNVFTSVQWQQKNNYNGVKGVYIVIKYTKKTD